MNVKESNKLSIQIQKDLYDALILPRLIEKKMLILLRQGKISKWFSGIGQEAIAVGVTKALDSDEYIFPMHRNLGVFTSRHVPLERLFAQFQGKASGFTKGRDRSFHFGSKEHHIVGMISHLGPQLALACGIALANLLEKNKKVCVAFSGEGGTSEGDFHEAMNVAAVWDLPVIFIVENNGYGLSTPTNEQYRCKDLVDRAQGYGMKGIKIDGNSIEDVYNTIQKCKKEIQKKPHPVLIECKTFRIRGHEEASGVKYVPKELIEEWKTKDPIQRFEQNLIEKGIFTTQELESIQKTHIQAIEDALKVAFAEKPIEANSQTELLDMYAPYTHQEVKPNNASKDMRFVDAISNALYQAMEKHSELVIMGQDIAEYGGVFKITENFIEDFGKDRVRNTPICESAIVGAALGLSINKHKAIVEMQFADFVSCGFNQIVNNLAKLHYRWQEKADVVVRMPCGAGVAAGPFHSQSNEAWFFHTPGLKVVYPSNPADAKGLLIAAIEDPNPVLFFEHKALYRSISEPVPTDYYNTEIGKAAIIQEGEDLTVITYGMGVHWAKKACNSFKDSSIEILDLRSLLPFDKEAIKQSVKKTGKVLILHEDCLTGGIGGELSAYISEHCFEFLDAPIVRCASMDTAVPFVKALEDQFLANRTLNEKLQNLIDY